MAKKNATLIGETAEVLLNKISSLAAEAKSAAVVKDLCDSFAAVVEHDQQVAGVPARLL